MSRTQIGILSALVALVLAAPALGAPTRLPDPEAALLNAERLLPGRSQGARPDATMALRDLALVADQLSPRDQRRAAALLDRPDDPQGSRGGLVRYTVPSTYFCTAHFCIHYVTSTVDAPPPHDGNANGIPDWVETTASVLEFLWTKEVDEYGFRPPKSDLELAKHGPDGRMDVYLADIVDGGILGFCAPEPPPNPQGWNVPGYCVLDNDYSTSQIGAPGLGGKYELELTAVHEFFHAIQFNYDFADDTWLLEGTATWIEDEVYESVNEPYRRFAYSALVRPAVPVDSADATQPFQYGAWVFWRFLEELLAPASTHKDPGVIRRIWEWADGSPGAPDLYSLQAAAATLAERRIPFRSAFLTFAVRNFIPATFYREGKQWPSPKPRSTLLSASRSVSARKSVVLDHLTSAYQAFVSGPGISRRARLSLAVDLPQTTTGSNAAAIVFRRSGAPQVRTFSLSLAGDGRLVVPFGRGAVTRVVLVLTNASERFQCGQLTRYSCRGIPRDENQRYAYSARVLG